MFNTLLYSALPLVISLAGITIALGTTVLWQRRRALKRWSPLTSKLLRSPGHSLFKEMDDLNLEIDSVLFILLAGPVWVYASHVSVSYFAAQAESLFRVVLNVLLVCVLVAYALVKLIRILEVKGRVREGYEAESAVGAELNQLMLDGAHVFHDLPGDGFNVDHVVVTPKGVFSVETKSRAKYFEAAGKASAKAEFDGKSLKFPSHSETAPVEQARDSAKWLSDWLSQATGESVTARPVLALPGWFITATARTNVVCMNGKGCRALFAAITSHQPLSPAQMQRVAFQIEQRCRDVEPTRYRKAARPLATAKT